VSRRGALMTADEVAARAAERAGLDDFGTPTWQWGLEILLCELDTFPDVSEKAMGQVTEMYVKALWNRLRVVDYAKRHPEVRAEQIREPLVILGMPRTGTTLVSNLLDQDVAHRSLLNWEAVDSIPPPTTATLHTDPRCVAKLERQREVVERILKSGQGTPHFEYADSPTECLFVQSQDFKGLRWDAFQPTDVYSDWLYNDCDMTSAYEYEKLVLQILQSGAPGKWSLKMPSHAVFVDTLLEVFDDARMIWTHRDPYKATGSLCSTIAPSRRIVGVTDASAIGRTAVKQIQQHVERPLRTRARVGDARFFHLHYANLMRDPIGEMRRLYAWSGEELTPATTASMNNWLRTNPQGRFGPRPYSLAEYGLTKEELVPVFEEYLDTFEIELEDAP
jgi:hypothetical protein